MVPLVIIQCFTEPESMLFLRRYRTCGILALDAPAGHAHESGGVGVYVELTMVPRTQPRPQSNTPWTHWPPGDLLKRNIALSLALSLKHNDKYHLKRVGGSSKSAGDRG